MLSRPCTLRIKAVTHFYVKKDELLIKKKSSLKSAEGYFFVWFMVGEQNLRYILPSVICGKLTIRNVKSSLSSYTLIRKGVLISP